ncbi:hypothetical protein SANTM175S_08278 [Streptomyces antimycoticus]
MRSVSSGSTSSSAACSAIIAPRAGSCCISRPRAATSVAASSSDSTPATCAAASSPMECPARTSGCSPAASASRNSATSIAERGLGEAGPVQRLLVVPEQHVVQRPFEVPVQLGADRVQRLREDRTGLIQLTAHAEPLVAAPPATRSARLLRGLPPSISCAAGLATREGGEARE